MSKALGIALIVAGVGVASSLLPLGSEADPALRQPVVASAPEPVRVTFTSRLDPSPESSAVTAAQPKPAPLAPAAPEPVVVTLTQRADPVAGIAPAARRAPIDKGTLARELQGELRRVGCYGGEINGMWTPAARRAMKAFVERVNATLPVNDPDDILLSLVRSHQGETCGKPCPAGEALSEEGRCLSSAVLTQAAMRPTPPPVRAAAAATRTPGEVARKPVSAVSGGWTTVTAAAPPAPVRPATAPSPPPGRMALAGPDAVSPGAVAGPKRAAVRAKRAGAAKLARARRPERMFVRTYAGRSTFVESILRDRRSLN